MSNHANKRIAVVAPDDIELNPVAIQEGTAALNLFAQQAHQLELAAKEMAARVGYTGPLVPALMEMDAARSMKRTLDESLALGAILLVFKELLEHGEYLNALERLRIPPRAAQRFTQAALRMAGKQLSTDLKNAIGNRAKLLEFLVLDDQEIKQLNEEGSVLGLAIDDFDRMTASQLRSAIRLSKKSEAAKDRFFVEQNKTNQRLQSDIDALRTFKPRADCPARTQEEKNALTALDDASNAAEAALAQLCNAAEDLGSSDSEVLRERARHQVSFIVITFKDLIAKRQLDVDADNEAFGLRAAWMGAAN